jgi:uncharacterized protein YciI
MATVRGELIREDYESNTWLIRRTVEGVTHEESLWQLPFKANCLNWVLGHIVAGRQITLDQVGGAMLWDEAKVTRYQGGSAPVTGAEDALALEVLLADVERSQGLLDKALNACSAADLERMVETGQGERTLWQVVAGRRWHETYHIGQLGTLRQFVEARRAWQEAARPQFIYTLKPVRPEMVTDGYVWTERENAIAAEHFAYLQRATEAGIVLLAGRAQDGIGPALVILEADSEAEAQQFMEGDPFVAHGLMRARLHPYRAALVRVKAL